MAFRIPTFNLTCRIHRFYTPTTSPPGGGWTSVLCQLRELKTAFISLNAQNASVYMLLALPALTDIRGSGDGGPPINNDIVECPQGSGVYWAALGVADVAKGFANEYRTCVVQRIAVAGGYPLP